MCTRRHTHACLCIDPRPPSSLTQPPLAASSTHTPHTTLAHTNNLIHIQTHSSPPLVVALPLQTHTSNRARDESHRNVLACFAPAEAARAHRHPRKRVQRLIQGRLALASLVAAGGFRSRRNATPVKKGGRSKRCKSFSGPHFEAHRHRRCARASAPLCATPIRVERERVGPRRPDGPRRAGGRPRSTPSHRSASPLICGRVARSNRPLPPPPPTRPPPQARTRADRVPRARACRPACAEDSALAFESSRKRRRRRSRASPGATTNADGEPR